MSANPQVLSIFYQAPSDGVAECVIVELAGGPKRFVRLWCDQVVKSVDLEWGWEVHESAEKVYEA